MALTKRKLSEFVTLFNQKCGVPDLMPDEIYGVNRDKELFAPSHQIGANTQNYKIVPPGCFACNLMHVGRDKVLPIARNNTSSDCVVSPAYTVFAFNGRGVLLSKYFFIYLKSEERDRYFWFHTDASVRDGMSWFDFCDLEIEFPSIEIQQKYVAIYEAMCANQRCYEAGLEDLRLACDAELEQLMGSIPLIPIAAFVDETDERNEGQYGLSNVRGISIEKKFIPTKAKMEGVSLSNYKVVRPREIAYVPVTSRNGEKITIAQNVSDDTFLISAAYLTFRCDEARLLPEYLMLFFTRSEFDRYARFNSWGSARETFDWTEMENVKIPIPSLDVQRSIADLFKAYNERKEINEKLKQQIRDLCSILIKGSLEEASVA